jgi:tRNA(adenine34) deaminase
MNYELFMGEALAEAQIALDQGKAPIGAVAVVSDAMVARAHDRVQESNDPTAHAVVVALREAARKLGRNRLADATIFVTREPCPMCVGALLASDVEALVFAVSNPVDGAAGGALQLAQDGRLSRRLKVVSGIRCEEAEELFAKAGPVESLRSAEPVKTVVG